MKKKLVWRSMVVLCTVLLLQLILLTHGFAYCVHRDTGAIEIPPGNDTWVEECCDGRPSHWPASAMPIPVFIYSATPAEFQQDIIDAVQAWNDIESSFFEMAVIGTIGDKSAIPGAIVMGFDPDHCADDNDCGIAGTGCKAVSVNFSWDGYQIQYCTIWADANAHDWNAPGAPNSLMVMTHELGHVLGIMHPGDNPHGPGGQGCGPEFNGATMACCGGQIDAATLELDDMAAATSLYPQWKYTVQVFDSSNNPIGGAAVWMEGTCLPHEGVNRHEGGMVFGDIPFCLTGESEASDTYYPNITYMTGPDGKTGEFRVMHDEFCFTVVADGFYDSYVCLTLPAPGNYITPVVLDRPPVCDANGPYTAECQGDTTTFSLDGTGSSDPDPGDTIAYSWTTSCPGGSFDNMNSPTPMLTLDSTTGSVVCDGSLTVSDTAGAVDSCSSTVTVVDTLPPSITCPPDVTIECDESTDPSNTGMATATDVCTVAPAIVYSDTTAPDSCPEESTITRTWTATDTSGNTDSCVQTIEVVDTTPPDIQCNAPATITPPDVPISFTATATDNCTADPSVEIIGYDCFKFTKKGKRIDKTESCIVEVNGDIVTIVDSGGVDDNITWTVRANDNCGNVAESTCSVLVVKPEKP